MSDLADWPDPYMALSSVLVGLSDGVKTASVGPETPEDPSGTYGWLPFVRITIVGGPDDGITDHPIVAVDVFAATRGKCSKLSGAARQRLLNGPHAIAGKAVVDRVTTSTRPSEVPYGDVNKVRCYAATYQAHLRRY